MSDKLDAVLGKITELTETVKGRAGDATLDKDSLVAEFGRLLEEQRVAIMDEMPARQGAFQTDPVNRAVEAYRGKYATELRSIAKDGEFRMGNWKLRGSDLILAKLLIDRANAIKAQNAGFSGSERVKPVSADLENAVKALTSTGSGTGDELVPTGMAAELWEDFFSASRVAADIPTQPMPTDPFDMPLGLGDVTWRKGTQNTAPTASDPATAKSTLTSTEQVAEVDWSYDLDEDSVVAVLPALRQRIGLSGGEQMDAFIINADATNAGTGNINLDDADPPDDSYYLSAGQDGIRHLALVDNTGQGSGVGAAIDDAKMVAILKLLGKYGLDYQNCRIVPDIATYFTMLGMTNVATVDKYGPQATILSGELARYRGIPVIPSASVPLTEADGKVSTTGGNNTKGQIVAYNRNMWRVGFRRQLLVEVDRLIQKRQLVMVVSFRIAVAAHGARASAKHAAVGYNITV